MGIKLAVVAALGPPAVAVLLFEVVLNATALFNHANIDLPRPVDRVLRLFVVTPDMHRVHHSKDPRDDQLELRLQLAVGGTGCSGPTSLSPPRGTKGWKSVSNSFVHSVICGSTRCWLNPFVDQRAATPRSKFRAEGSRRMILRLSSSGVPR